MDDTSDINFFVNVFLVLDTIMFDSLNVNAKDTSHQMMVAYTKLPHGVLGFEYPVFTAV
jgi:hypothetical protein